MMAFVFSSSSCLCNSGDGRRGVASWNERWCVWVAPCETQRQISKTHERSWKWIWKFFFQKFMLPVTCMSCRCSLWNNVSGCETCMNTSGHVVAEDSVGTTANGYKRVSHHCAVWDDTISAWVNSTCLSNTARVTWSVLVTPILRCWAMPVLNSKQLHIADFRFLFSVFFFDFVYATSKFLVNLGYRRTTTWWQLGFLLRRHTNTIEDLIWTISDINNPRNQMWMNLILLCCKQICIYPFHPFLVSAPDLRYDEG